MVFITPSGFGLKCAFEARAEIGDIAANQQAFAMEAGLKLDEVCIDASRLSFVPLYNDILLLEDSLFTYENQAFIERYTKQYFKGVASSDCFGGNVVSEGPAVPDHTADAAAVDFSDYRYCGVEIPVIIEKLGVVECPPEGKRHHTIFETAKKLRYVCERSKDKVEFFSQAVEMGTGSGHRGPECEPNHRGRDEQALQQLYAEGSVYDHQGTGSRRICKTNILCGDKRTKEC